MTLAALPPRTDNAPRLAAAGAPHAFWWRALATVVDLLALALLDGFVTSVYGVTHVTSGSPVPVSGGDFTRFTTSTDVGVVWPMVLWLVYYISLEALFGATIGKWVCRLRVTDGEGRLPSHRGIVTRNVARIVDGFPAIYLVGGVIALRSPLRQRLGDHLAHTVVVRREALAAPLLTHAQLHRRVALVGGALLLCLAFSGAFYYYGRAPLVVQGLANTQQMMFSDGVSSYTLGAPTWGAGVVTYDITYQTTRPVNTCHARLTLRWTFPTGWEPANALTSCDTPTP